MGWTKWPFCQPPFLPTEICNSKSAVDTTIGLAKDVGCTFSQIPRSLDCLFRPSELEKKFTVKVSSHLIICTKQSSYFSVRTTFRPIRKSFLYADRVVALLSDSQVWRWSLPPLRQTTVYNFIHNVSITRGLGGQIKHAASSGSSYLFLLHSSCNFHCIFPIPILLHEILTAFISCLLQNVSLIWTSLSIRPVLAT